MRWRTVSGTVPNRWLSNCRNSRRASFSCPSDRPSESPFRPSLFPDRFRDGLAHESDLLLTIDIRLCRLGRRQECRPFLPGPVRGLPWRIPSTRP